MAFVLDPTKDLRLFDFNQYIAMGGSTSDTIATAITNLKGELTRLGTGGVCTLCAGTGKITKDKVTGDPNDSAITITCPPSSAPTSGCNGYGVLVTQQQKKTTFTNGQDIG